MTACSENLRVFVFLIQDHFSFIFCIIFMLLVLFVHGLYVCALCYCPFVIFVCMFLQFLLLSIWLLTQHLNIQVLLLLLLSSSFFCHHYAG